jgi:hypothetical protein
VSDGGLALARTSAPRFFVVDEMPTRRRQSPLLYRYLYGTGGVPKIFFFILIFFLQEKAAEATKQKEEKRKIPKLEEK